MYTFFIAIEILVSVLLMVAVLMQASKGGGLAGTLGSSNMGTVFGVRRTSDFLTKTTTILAAVPAERHPVGSATDSLAADAATDTATGAATDASADTSRKVTL
jgi:preprotein translocase subunit SecG